MKKFLLCLLILLQAVITKAQTIEKNPVLPGSKIPKNQLIEKCEEYAVKINDQTIKNSFLYRRYKYNKDGNLVSDVRYSLENTSDSTYIAYTYNGLMLEMKKYPQYINMETDIVEAATVFFEYDSQMRLARKTIITAAGDTTVYTYHYNQNNSLDTIYADSAIDRRYTLFYDISGKAVRKLGETPIKDSAGWLLTDSFNYEYDGKNNLIKEIHIKEDSERKRSLFEYNTQGKLTKKIVHVYGDTKPVYTTEYTYDTKTGLPQSRSVKTLPDKNKLEYRTVKYIYTYTYQK